MDTIKHYANFPATGVSLRQMVQFGERPSTGLSICHWFHQRASAIVLTLNPKGTLFRASQFLSEELPIRLAHRVQELQELPDGLNEMPSIKKVQDWYAQSFEVSCGKWGLLTDESGWMLMNWYEGNHNTSTARLEKRHKRKVDETFEAYRKIVENSYRGNREPKYPKGPVQFVTMAAKWKWREQKGYIRLPKIFCDCGWYKWLAPWTWRL